MTRNEYNCKCLFCEKYFISSWRDDYMCNECFGARLEGIYELPMEITKE